MDDERIIALFFARDERALGEVKRKYGRYCHSIAYRILGSHEDAEECENDTWLSAWRQIPPTHPQPLSGFLGMLTRRISLDRWRRDRAQKRGGGEVMLSFEELEECIPHNERIDETVTAETIARVLSELLAALPGTEADVFVRRYWYFDSVREIAERYGFGESRVKMMLKRTRDRLRKQLKKEGILV